MVLGEALHPRPPLVVDEEYGDALRGLDQEDAAAPRGVIAQSSHGHSIGLTHSPRSHLKSMD